MSAKNLAVEFGLREGEAMALAQFLKRVGWSEIRVNACDDQEAYLMRDALDEVRKALAYKGFAPR